MTAKGKAKLARVVAIRRIALRLIGRNGHWQRINNGPEVMKYENGPFLMMFYVRDPVPVEFRRKFNLDPLSHGLYSLELWVKGVGKVLNLFWDSVGAVPQITTFRRGAWEEVFLPPSSRGEVIPLHRASVHHLRRSRH